MNTLTSIYQDIAKRTAGDIYIGVVGPARTGKSTFIKRFMETMVLPNITDEYRRERARDELPQSGSGRTVMTAEPKFVPEEAVEIAMEGGGAFSVRLIDCVGYLVPGAVGQLEDDLPRMSTPPGSPRRSPWRRLRRSAPGRSLPSTPPLASWSPPTGPSPTWPPGGLPGGGGPGDLRAQGAGQALPHPPQLRPAGLRRGPRPSGPSWRRSTT